MTSGPISTSHVRFTREQYLKLKMDEVLTGKSIPWLLKTAYFKNGISAPTLDRQAQQAVLRELSYIGNNLNQLTRQVNSGLISHVKEEVQEMLGIFRTLKSFLGLEYGDRKDSL